MSEVLIAASQNILNSRSISFLMYEAPVLGNARLGLISSLSEYMDSYVYVNVYIGTDTGFCVIYDSIA